MSELFEDATRKKQCNIKDARQGENKDIKPG